MTNELIRLNAVLEEVGRLDGIEGLRLAADGTGGMELKNGVKVLFEYVQESGRLFLYTPLTKVPEEERQRCALFGALLSRNFLELGNGRGSLAVFEHTAQVVYQVGLEAAQVDAQRLDRAIDALLRSRSEILRKMEDGDTAIVRRAASTEHQGARIRGPLAPTSGANKSARGRS
jgi:hypothetical protein